MVIESAEPGTSAYDEVFEPDGSPRPIYERLVGTLLEAGIRETRRSLGAHLRAAGVTFGEGDENYSIDPLPRLIEHREWARVSAGLAQRYDAINAFLDDAYGGRALVDEGVIPARVLEESGYYEPLAEGQGCHAAPAVGGPDLIRDPSGELLVLEDNLRTPSGIAYAIAGRNAVRECGVFPDTPVIDRTLILDRLITMLRDATPSGLDDPSIAMLSDGPASKAWFEHREIAAGLQIPVVRTDELVSREGRLYAVTGEHRFEIHVLYNRSSAESLRQESGELSPLGDLLKEPLERGTLACVNPFGAGIADDKAIHCYVDDMIPFYLGEEPLVRSVPSFDLGEPDQRDAALSRLDELVVKPRWSFGGQGIVLGPKASSDELEEVRSNIERDPSAYVAQPTVAFSVHPTAIGDRLEPRHVDLRAFVVPTADGFRTLPVALSRFAGQAGEMVVNSTQGGGMKDTWLPEARRERQIHAS